jgi:hypothetical protein
VNNRRSSPDVLLQRLSVGPELRLTGLVLGGGHRPTAHLLMFPFYTGPKIISIDPGRSRSVA